MQCWGKRLVSFPWPIWCNKQAWDKDQSTALGWGDQRDDVHWYILICNFTLLYFLLPTLLLTCAGALEKSFHPGVPFLSLHLPHLDSVQISSLFQLPFGGSSTQQAWSYFPFVPEAVQQRQSPVQGAVFFSSTNEPTQISMRLFLRKHLVFGLAHLKPLALYVSLPRDIPMVSLPLSLLQSAWMCLFSLLFPCLWTKVFKLCQYKDHYFFLYMGVDFCVRKLNLLTTYLVFSTSFCGHVISHLWSHRSQAENHCSVMLKYLCLYLVMKMVFT